MKMQSFQICLDILTLTCKLIFRNKNNRKRYNEIVQYRALFTHSLQFMIENICFLNYYTINATNSFFLIGKTYTEKNNMKIRIYLCIDRSIHNNFYRSNGLPLQCMHKLMTELNRKVNLKLLFIYLFHSFICCCCCYCW